MSILLGIDTGGTYTDAVLLDDERGVIGKAKALTTKHDLFVGIQSATEAVLQHPLPDIQLVSLSTTLATNAIGAVAGEVMQTVRILVRPLDWAKAYRVHLPFEAKDFPCLEDAVAYAQDISRQLAEDHARRAGASLVQVNVMRHDRTAIGGGGWPEEIYLETEVVATAVGRMPLGV